MDAFESVKVCVFGEEDDGHFAHFVKPSSGLDAFATSFKTNVHQDNIGLIAHCKQEGFLSVCGYIAHVEAKRLHVCFEADGDHEFVVNDQGAAAMREGGMLGHCKGGL